MATTKKAPKLTAEQRRRVREMVEDEGHSRAEAVAWVLHFEPTHYPDMSPSGPGEVVIGGSRHRGERFDG